MDTSQYLSMFLEETMDTLQNLNDSLLQLEQEPGNKDKLNEIFRAAHTIKGMAATMGYQKMADLTHKMEDVLSEFKDGKLEVTQNVVTILFKCLDTLEKMLDNIQNGIDEEVPVDEIIKELHSLIVTDGSSSKADESVKEEKADNEAAQTSEASGDEIALNEYDLNVIKQANEKGFNAFKIKVFLSESTLLKSARAFLIFKNLEETGEIIKSIPSVEDIEDEKFGFEIKLVLLTKKSKDEISDILMDVSEVKKVEIEEVDYDKEKPTEELTPKKDKEASKNVQPKPIEAKKPAASKKPAAHKNSSGKKMHQSVRVDLEKLDKFMNLVSELVINRTRLEEITSDSKVVELNETLEQVARTTGELQDLVMKIRMLPLEIVFSRFPRMIRDLSVELKKDMELVIEGQDTELDRTVIDEIGEPLIHLLRNSADHGIESREDRIRLGKDPVGKISLIAYQEGTKAIIKVKDDGRGLNVEKIKAKAEKSGISTEGMSEADIKNLIFMQGFSTSDKVTEISGRGVGMDVVKTKISALGGVVDVVSKENVGTTFTIRLPLTLQIIQALLVKVGTETMAISLGYIDTVKDARKEMVKKSNNKEVIIYDGKVIPFIRLYEKLGIERSENNKNYIVIAKVGDKTVGLLVDSLLGQQEIVIKPLGKTLKGLKEYIGATILGNGLVTLILDVGSLT